ncbi:MAG: hypothetical protein ACI4EA_11910, partial [Candidatus Ornithomonoglobus sp.]
LLPIENGADKPDSEPRYSSEYTKQPAVLSNLISGSDGVSSEMFDYGVDDGTYIGGLGANSQTGTNNWQYVGSSSYTKYVTAVKDGMTAVDLYNNGSGTFSLTKYFNGYQTVDSGKVHMHFQAAFLLGAFTVKLTNTAKAASWMDGMTVMSVGDGTVYMYDGTAAGQLKNGKWTDVDIWIDLDRGTESISVAGDEPVMCDIEKLQTSNKSDADSLLPLRGLNFIYTSHPSTIVSYTFETYITDLSVTSVETDTPQVTAEAYVEAGSEGMGSVSGSGSFVINSDVTLTASAAEGYSFKGWYTADGELYSTEKTLTIQRMRNDISLAARFAVQKHKEDIVLFEIGSDKSAVKVGSSINLYPQNARDSEGGEVDAVTASDIAWSCGEDGITIDDEGVLEIDSGYSMEENSLKTITVIGEINGYTACLDITVYSYAYYDEITEKSPFNGSFLTIADKAAIVWPGASAASVYTLDEPVIVDRDMQITYSNAWSGQNTAGQYRYIALKNSDSQDILRLYYCWTDLYAADGVMLSSAVGKDVWTDIVIDIEKESGKVTISGNGNQLETSVSAELLTDIAAIELSSARSCPGPEQRALGIGKIIISTKE